MIETLFMLLCIFITISLCLLGYISYRFRKQVECNDWHLLGVKSGRAHSPNEYTSYGEMLWYYRRGNDRFVISGVNDGWYDGSHTEISGRIPEVFRDKSDGEIQQYLIKQYTPWVKEKTLCVMGEDEDSDPKETVVEQEKSKSDKDGTSNTVALDSNDMELLLNNVGDDYSHLDIEDKNYALGPSQYRVVRGDDAEQTKQ